MLSILTFLFKLYFFIYFCLWVSQGISPLNILAMTFTTAAAAEMRERIAKVAGKTIAKELTISTFHSFSLQLCRSNAEKYAISELHNIILYLLTMREHIVLLFHFVSEPE